MRLQYTMLSVTSKILDKRVQSILGGLVCHNLCATIYVRFIFLCNIGMCTVSPIDLFYLCKPVMTTDGRRILLLCHYCKESQSPGDGNPFFTSHTHSILFATVSIFYSLSKIFTLKRPLFPQNPTTYLKYPVASYKTHFLLLTKKQFSTI